MAGDQERSDGELNADACVLPLPEQTFYFLRGHLQIPVLDGDLQTFTWSVWVSLSEANMRALASRWDDLDRTALPTMFGWLSTVLTPYQPATTNLATNVMTRAPGLVPLIHLNPGDEHPLAQEQRNGITMHRVAELNRLLHVGGAARP